MSSQVTTNVHSCFIWETNNQTSIQKNNSQDVSNDQLIAKINTIILEYMTDSHLVSIQELINRFLTNVNRSETCVYTKINFDILLLTLQDIKIWSTVTETPFPKNIISSKPIKDLTKKTNAHSCGCGGHSEKFTEVEMAQKEQSLIILSSFRKKRLSNHRIEVIQDEPTPKSRKGLPAQLMTPPNPMPRCSSDNAIKNRTIIPLVS